MISTLWLFNLVVGFGTNDQCVSRHSKESINVRAQINLHNIFSF
jgi:hypothetical protein